MLTIQEAHRYIKIVNYGFAKPIVCLNDKDHLNLVSWVDDNEDVVFMCLACSYKIRPGEKMSKYIRSVNEKFTS
jgi:hypothetical protein